MFVVNVKRGWSCIFVLIACVVSSVIIVTHSSPLVDRLNVMNRRSIRQAPLYSSIHRLDTFSRELSPQFRTSYNQRNLNPLPSAPPPQRNDYYGVGGLMPQGNFFSTPEDRLITNRDPSIVTIVENALSRFLVPLVQVLAPISSSSSSPSGSASSTPRASA